MRNFQNFLELDQGIEAGFKFWSMTWADRERDEHKDTVDGHRNQVVRLPATRTWREM